MYQDSRVRGPFDVAQGRELVERFEGSRIQVHRAKGRLAHS
jgi:hypothetical protein